MVHALSEVRRVLSPDGILIDLRPLADNWPVEVVSLREVRRTGSGTASRVNPVEATPRTGSPRRMTELDWPCQERQLRLSIIGSAITVPGIGTRDPREFDG